MSGRRGRASPRGTRAIRAMRGPCGESLIEVLLALWIVATLALELARVELQQLRLRQALDLRLRAAVELDTFAETRRAIGDAVVAADWAPRVAHALPDGRIVAMPATGGVVRVEVSWRRAPRDDAAGSAATAALPGSTGGTSSSACATLHARRDCLAIVLPDVPHDRLPAPDALAAIVGGAAPTARAAPAAPPTAREGRKAPEGLAPPVGATASPARPPSPGGRRIAGHTLLELLIAAVLGGMVVTAALAVFHARRDGQARRVDDARMRLDGHAAIDVLRAYARLAGYGMSFASGTASSASAILSCPPGARLPEACVKRAIPDSDGLVIRYRADPVSASRSAGSPSQLLDCGGRLLPGWGVITAARIAVMEDAIHGLPRLHCRGPGPSSDPLVEGVERLRIRYWLAGRRAPVAARAPGGKVPAARGLAFCVTVRGHLRRPPRAAARTGGYRDCDGRWQPDAGDGYARRTFTATVALRNADGALGGLGAGGGHRP